MGSGFSQPPELLLYQLSGTTDSKALWLSSVGHGDTVERARREHLVLRSTKMSGQDASEVLVHTHGSVE